MANSKSKYGAISELRQPRPAKLDENISQKLDPQVPSKGRRAGKRSDPEYSPTTFFVRKETKRKAAKLLLDDDRGGKDLSDIVEALLSQWVADNSAK